MSRNTPMKLVSVRNDSYECVACGHEENTPQGICPQCGAHDGLARREDVQEDPTPEERPTRRRARPAQRVSSRLPKPFSTGRQAWDHVLGGGLVKPSSVLVYGPRGVGKSTNLLRVATHAAKAMGGCTLYGSSEMPAEHLRMVIDRLGVPTKDLWISDSGDTEDMLEDIEELEPAVIVWDSIQRFRWEGALGEVELKSVVHAAIQAGIACKAVTLLVSQ